MTNSHLTLLVFAAFSWYKGEVELKKILIQKAYLRVNNEYFSLWDSNLPVTKFVCVSIAKSRIEWIIISREKSFDILQKNSGKKMPYKFYIIVTWFCYVAFTSRQAILNSWGALLITFHSKGDQTHKITSQRHFKNHGIRVSAKSEVIIVI